MTTDEERREVARRLREANVRRQFYSPWCRMVESVLDGIDCGEDDGTCDENACCERFMKRMADLIEPTTGDYDEGYRAGLQKARDMCDRDALLAPAQEMVEAFRLGAFTGEGLDAKWCRELHDKYARRVREALEVES